MKPYLLQFLLMMIAGWLIRKLFVIELKTRPVDGSSKWTLWFVTAAAAHCGS